MNGKNITKYRNDNGISQIELADKLEISKSTLWRWENNKTAPKGEDLEKLRSLIGEEYISNEDLSSPKSTGQTFADVSDRVDDILYQISKIESKQRTFDDDNNRLIAEHRLIRTVAIVMASIVIIVLAFLTWLIWINSGFHGEVVEGPAEMGTPSYFEIDDGK